MGRKRLLTEEQEAELIAWWKSPRSITAKAKSLGISNKTLYDYVYGVQKARRSPHNINHLIDEISRKTEKFHVLQKGDLNADAS